tara:strand:- start:255 stop:410 length:156 start_codon:yes stop_codon:yes gene_type:complete
MEHHPDNHHTKVLRRSFPVSRNIYRNRELLRRIPHMVYLDTALQIEEYLRE